MKKQIIAVAALCALASGAAMAQQAKEGPWMVRVRAVHLDSANTDGTGLGLTINNKWLPEADISYFFTKELSAELILTVPQAQSVYSKGTKIGSLRHLPPTLTAQYHFDLGGARPYVGAGINYTRFSSVNILSGAATIDKNSWGGALQVGVDVPLGNAMFFNVDLKKAYLGTHVYAGGKDAGSFKVDPILLGVGLGWRF